MIARRFAVKLVWFLLCCGVVLGIARTDERKITPCGTDAECIVFNPHINEDPQHGDDQ